MNKLILILGAAALFAATFSLMGTKTNNQPITQEVMNAFQRWQLIHGKTYNSEDQQLYRMQIFANNLKMIEEQNAQENGVTYAMNQFGDISREEFISTYLGTIPQQLEDVEIVEYAKASGDIDWRQRGDVQKVKNQGQCGSCWAFSTTAVVESASAVAGKGLLNLAEQQLVDCSRSYGNYGCNGGWPSNALKYVQANGLVDESSYAYVARDQQCKINSGPHKITGQKATNTCTGLTGALNTEPVSVCVDASNWQFYSKGVFSNCGTGINHAVLAVGSNQGNWIIKNSWGTSWGEQGYITLKSGNTCAVCNVAVTASV